MVNLNDKLFLRILQIGRDNIQNGIRFSDLLNQLKSEGFTINNCTNRTLREWFYTSFFHEEAHCAKDSPGSYTDVTKLDEHQKCSFILKGDSCMKLLQYEVSDISNEQLNTLRQQISFAQESANEARSDANTAKLLAILAIILSAIVSLPDWVMWLKPIPDHSNQFLEIQQNQLVQQEKTNIALDSLIKLHHLEQTTKPKNPNTSGKKKLK